MDNADRKAFAEALGDVYALYRADLSPGVMRIWWAALQAYDLPAVREALGRHAVNPDTGQFLPKPADVVKMLGGSTLDAAMVAWSKVESAVQRCGAYATVAFDDPLIHRVLDEMGGWVQVCKGTMKEWPFTQREFENRYRAHRVRSVVPPYPPVLLGLIDGENMGRGYPPGPVALLGDEARARQVVAGGSDTARLPVKVAALLGVSA